MAGVIPWRRRKAEPAGNSGALAPLQDFPARIRRMQSEFDELFERFGQAWPLEDFGRGWRWGLDVEEKEDYVILRAEAPGFEAGDFDLCLSGDQLILRASRRAESKAKEGECREERKCYESITLPLGIDKDKVDAKYHNGVLTVTIPKSKEGRGKKITVKNA